MKNSFASRAVAYVSCRYIEFVYKTSRIEVFGDKAKLERDCEETFIICFWHGDCYSYYPLLSDRDVCIITTVNARGDTVERILRHFGYTPYRLPDNPEGGNHIFKLRDIVNGETKRCLALTLDGPLGPYREPKKFAALCAVVLKKRLLPLSVNVKRGIRLTRRWDKYVIPLPFNHITFHVKEPVAANGKNPEAALAALKNAMDAAGGKAR